MQEQRGKIRLFGFGMDDSGEDIYLTNAKEYQLVRGSGVTHQRMRERALEFFGRIREKGLSPNNISRSECSQIMQEMGLVVE